MIENLLSKNAVYFLKAYEFKSFSAAARQLNVSQSTLSLAIKEFEFQLSKKLFLRNRGGSEVLPTPEAKQLFEKLTEVKEKLPVDMLEKDVKVDPLKIATIQHFARNNLLPSLSKLGLLANTKIFIVRSNKAIEAIKSQKIDLAFVLAQKPPFRKSPHCIELQMEKIGVVGLKEKYAHILKAKNLEDLKNEAWIVGDRVREDWPDSIEEYKQGFYIEDHFSARFLVLEGYGIAQLQLDYFSSEEMDKLVISKVKLPHDGLKLYALIRKNLTVAAENQIKTIIRKIQCNF